MEPSNNRLRLSLITGGIRSGKSEVAEGLAHELGDAILYLATGVPSDDEMRTRIDIHQRRRPLTWITVEAALGDLAGVVEPHLNRVHGLLLDDLGGLATRAVMNCSSVLEADAWMEREERALWSLLEAADLPGIAVTSEVGLALLPTSELGRHFVDVLGRANQRWASLATNVTIVVAGLPWRLK